MRLLLALSFCLSLATAAGAQAPPPAPEPATSLSSEEIARRAAELAGLRAEIAQVEAELRLLRDEEQLAVRSIGGQIADLRITLADLSRRRDALRRTLADEEAEIRARSERSEGLETSLRESLMNLRRSVASGLPFQAEARLEAVDALLGKLEGGTTPPEGVLSETIRFLEDELQLTEGFGLYTQSIEWNGSRVLAEVVRLGMVALYVRTNDGEIGQAVSVPDGGHRFEAVTAPDDVSQIEKLFDAMDRAVRRGLFVVPLPDVAR